MWRTPRQTDRQTQFAAPSVITNWKSFGNILCTMNHRARASCVQKVGLQFVGDTQLPDQERLNQDKFDDLPITSRHPVMQLTVVWVSCMCWKRLSSRCAYREVVWRCIYFGGVDPESVDVFANHTMFNVNRIVNFLYCGPSTSVQ